MSRKPTSQMTEEELDELYQAALDREKQDAEWDDRFHYDDDNGDQDCWDDDSFLPLDENEDLDLEEFEENRRRRIAEQNEY